ncbi:prolipoprotein [Mycoplasma wenyonii str. Massachusetts]|uniref:Prolipoprotein n=1 Tax=Mycoplasma wenyonii (strain Massachusetts) TaxID=1197325 RepID=I6YL74_MYCWM|nr:hypothetical protein [Mycoplasma wenyonii]AFN65019.1 prolipoprotein [Mycoplasma wenyonii str. Massachusetts]
MAFLTSSVLNGLKVLLVLGVGLGGHQIYWKLAGNYVDDGFFYFADKMFLPNKDFLKKNKVYNSWSAISKSDEYLTRKDIANSYRNSYHVGFKANAKVRDKLNTLYYNGFGDRASVYKVIKDHTLKLGMPCSAGTGWLLDFEMPKDGKYPTKWFIATNLHVINMFRFKSNPYNVSLPIASEYLSNLRLASYGRYLNSCEDAILNNKSELQLYTEKDEYDRNIYPQDTTRVNSFRNSYSYWNLSERQTIYTTTISNPKLVYAAIDFLGPRYTVSGHKNSKESYFKDFGVMEVDFANEDQARIMTNGTYDKYYKTKVERQRPAVDFFAPELMSTYDAHELANSEDRYYIGGYPGSVSDNLSFNINAKLKLIQQNRWSHYDYYYPNYDTELTNSKLTYFKKVRGNDDLITYNLLNSRGQVIPGHADINKVDSITNDSKIMWNGKQLNGWGYNYLIDNTFLGRGASGSMVLNQHGELLGLYRMYNESFNFGFVEPLRASWVVDEKGKIILPGFDLLTGTENQAISYKSQLLRHNPNLNTYLKSKSWNLKS